MEQKLHRRGYALHKLRRPDCVCAAQRKLMSYATQRGVSASHPRHPRNSRFSAPERLCTGTNSQERLPILVILGQKQIFSNTRSFSINTLQPTKWDTCPKSQALAAHHKLTTH